MSTTEMRSNTPSKICLVTGGNSGIGYAIAEELVRLNHTVIIVCRDPQKGEEALDKIISRFPQADIELVIGDLSSIRTVHQLGAELTQRFRQIDILIHNAGIWQLRKELNEDGLEKSFMVNYLAVFLLTYLLWDLLQESDQSRIVLVNAGLYPSGEFDPGVTPYGENFSRFRSYADSKLCQLLFIKKLYRDIIEGSNPLINAVHPGVFKTKLGNTNGILGLLIKFLKLFWKSSEQSFIGPVYLALSKEVSESGNFYDHTKKIELEDKVTNKTAQEELWALSEKLCDLSWHS